MDLLTLTEDVPMFSLNGFVTEAKIVKVYDGDTVHVVFKYFEKYFKWIGRIAHVDTPELRTKNAEEKKKGYEVRDKLRELILGKVVQLHCHEFDKYGRLLLDIHIDHTLVDKALLPDGFTGTVKVDEWLISCGYAKKYEGGTKEKW